jgi:hypothetical protein
MINKLLYVLLFMCLGCQACVDSCMSYGSTVQNIYPYNKGTLAYLYKKDIFEECKQCYFSVSVPTTNTFHIGLYYNNNSGISYFSSATYTSDLILNTGFTTCEPGYCGVVFQTMNLMNFVSIQTLSAPSISKSCVFNNTHCSSSGVISAPMNALYFVSNKYELLNCTL